MNVNVPSKRPVKFPLTPLKMKTQAGESKDEKVEAGKKLNTFRLTYCAMIARERTVLLLSARLNYKRIWAVTMNEA